MTNPINVTGALAGFKSLETAMLASTNADLQNVGAKITTLLAAGEDVVTALRGAAGPLAAQFVNAGIGALAAAEPAFGLLIPAEGIIDPTVSGLTTAVENMLLGAPAAPSGSNAPE